MQIYKMYVYLQEKRSDAVPLNDHSTLGLMQEHLKVYMMQGSFIKTNITTSKHYY